MHKLYVFFETYKTLLTWLAGGVVAVFGFIWRHVLREKATELKKIYQDAKNMDKVNDRLRVMEDQLGIIVDTVRQIAFQQRREQALMLMVQESSQNAVCEFDPEGKLTWATSRVGELLDGSPYGNNWISKIALPDRERISREWQNCVRDRREFNETYTVSHCDGRQVIIRQEAWPLLVENYDGKTEFSGFFSKFLAVADKSV